tara:strand:+ start:460 stop:642 length:183 start_codon:yes stop_codon:yes gene_type:complete
MAEKNDSIKVDWVGLGINLILEGKDSEAVKAFQNAYNTFEEKYNEREKSESLHNVSNTKQ